MSLRSPIARARGLGSAKDGTTHFWVQRLTAIALVPLLLWLVSAVVGLVGADHASVVAWVAYPVNAVLLLVLVLTMCWHSMLGMQVIVEDYLHGGWSKMGALIVLKFGHVLVAIAGSFAILNVAFTGGAG